MHSRRETRMRICGLPESAANRRAAGELYMSSVRAASGRSAARVAHWSAGDEPGLAGGVSSFG